MLRLLCRNERYVKVNTSSLRLICITLQCAVQLVVALTRCSGFRQISAKELGRLPFLEYLHFVKNGIWSLITNVSSCLASLSVSHAIYKLCEVCTFNIVLFLCLLVWLHLYFSTLFWYH
jgi:hypothetical protein